MCLKDCRIISNKGRGNIDDISEIRKQPIFTFIINPKCSGNLLMSCMCVFFKIIIYNGSTTNNN